MIEAETYCNAEAYVVHDGLMVVFRMHTRLCSLLRLPSSGLCKLKINLVVKVTIIYIYEIRYSVRE